MTTSHKDVNKKIAARLLEIYSHLEVTDGRYIAALKAAKSIEECNAEIRDGAASSMYGVGPRFVTKVVQSCVLY
jgi:hypothetical protein